MVNLNYFLFRYILPIAASTSVIGTAIYQSDFFNTNPKEKNTFEPTSNIEEQITINNSQKFQDLSFSKNNETISEQIVIDEAYPISSLEEKQEYLIRKIEIENTETNKELTIFNSRNNNKNDSVDSNIYQILDSFELDSSTFLDKKNIFSNSKVVLDFSLEINSKNNKLFNKYPNFLSKNIFLTHVLSYDELVSLGQKTINVAKITFPNLNNSQNIFLQINKESNNKKTKIFLLLQNDKQIIEPLFVKRENAINFHFLYKNHEISKEQVIEHSSEKIQKNIKLSDVLRKEKKSNKKSISKNWMPEWIFSGYEPTHKGTKSERKFYIEKGNIHGHNQLLDDPTTVNSIPENQKLSPFKLLESNNPKKIGGYLKEAEPINFDACKNNKQQCKEDVSNNKKLSAGHLSQIGNFIDYDFEEIKPPNTFKHGGFDKDVYYVRRLCRWNESKKNQTQTCAIQPYDYAWKPNGISPHIAKNLYTYMTGQNTETIPWFEYYKDKYKLPNLDPQFLQSVYEQKDKPQLREGDKSQITANSSQQNANSNLDSKNSYFLNYEVPFRTMGGDKVIQRWQGWREHSADKPYDEEAEKNLRSKHSMTYKILKKDWDEKLIKSDFWGKDGIPSNQDKKTKLGLIFNMPIKLKIQDVAHDFSWQGDFNINEEIDLSNFNYWSNFLVNTYTIPLSELNPEGIGITNFIQKTDKRITKLHGNLKFFVYASLGEDGLKIEIQTQTEGIVNDRVSVFNLRDLDVSLSPRTANGKPTVMIGPHHIKMPTLIGVEFLNNASIIPFWWKTSAEDDFTIEQLETNQIKNKKNISYTKKLNNSEKQTQYTLDISSKIIDNKKTSNKSENLPETEKKYSGLFTTNNYLNIFGINETAPKEEKITKIKVPLTSETSNNYQLKLSLEGLDEESATLLFNSKYKHATKQTIFTNGNNAGDHNNNAYDSSNSNIFKEEPIKDGSTTQHKYETKEENKSFFDLKKYDLPTDLLIDITKISTDENKPTLIPFRLTVNYDDKYQKKSWSDLQTAIKKVANQLLKNDKTKLGKSVNDNTNSQIVDVSRIKELTSIKSSFAAVFWDVLVWKSQQANDLVLNVQLKIWGWGYSYSLASNDANTNTIGADGAAGFQLSNIYVDQKNKKHNFYQVVE